jgi:hypothetical protein
MTRSQPRQSCILALEARAMDEVNFSRITLSKGHPVRIRRQRGGRMVVEGWNGAAWVKGPDAADWANGRLATRKELRALGIPLHD